MTYVCILRSVERPRQLYIGWTGDLRNRFGAHNSGRSPHTRKFRPVENSLLRRVRYTLP